MGRKGLTRGCSGQRLGQFADLNLGVPEDGGAMAAAEEIDVEASQFGHALYGSRAVGGEDRWRQREGPSGVGAGVADDEDARSGVIKSGVASTMARGVNGLEAARHRCTVDEQMVGL